MTLATKTTHALTLAALAVTATMAAAPGASALSIVQAPSPEACVQQVMNGSVNWGRGTTWQRQNAVDLCRGAEDHGARITCFTGMVAGGTHWSQAIDGCQSIGTAPVPVVETATINGYTVGMVRFGGGAFEQRGNGWIETGKEGQARFSFDETGRDEWSVYLHDTSRNVRLQLDLHRDLVLYEGTPLYPITSVAKARSIPGRVKHPYTIAVGPIWNNADAQGKCADVAARQGAEWTGQWWTTVQGEMSVCQLLR